jgi:hypothetical protein
MYVVAPHTSYLDSPPIILPHSSIFIHKYRMIWWIHHIHSPFFLSFFSVWLYWALNSGPTPWATPAALFCDGCFRDRVSQTICLGLLQTVILLVSASWQPGLQAWGTVPGCICSLSPSPFTLPPLPGTHPQQDLFYLPVLNFLKKHFC